MADYITILQPRVVAAAIRPEHSASGTAPRFRRFSR
jgi:hypothetical protein